MSRLSLILGALVLSISSLGADWQWPRYATYTCEGTFRHTEFRIHLTHGTGLDVSIMSVFVEAKSQTITTFDLIDGAQLRHTYDEARNEIVFSNKSNKGPEIRFPFSRDEEGFYKIARINFEFAKEQPGSPVFGATCSRIVTPVPSK